METIQARITTLQKIPDYAINTTPQTQITTETKGNNISNKNTYQKNKTDTPETQATNKRKRKTKTNENETKTKTNNKNIE